MVFWDKLNNIAATAGEKASGAIEIGKLNLKLGTEEKKIEDLIIQLGSTLLLNLDAGQAYDETIMALYEEVKAARAAIASLHAEIANLTGSLLCPSCQEKNPADSKFCRECGTNLQEQTSDEAPVEIVETVCPACGSPVNDTDHFCTQCGNKLS